MVNANLGQAVNLGGLAQGPPNLIYLDAILASLSSALIFSRRSGSVAISNATLGLNLDPFGRPRRLGGSAGPRLPSGMWESRSPRKPQGSANLGGPGAVGAFSEMEDEEDDGLMVSAANPACSGSLLWRGSNRILVSHLTSGLLSTSYTSSIDSM